MKSYPLPANFQSLKFAARYSLDPLNDYFVRDGMLWIVPTLPDDPPIFDPADAPLPLITDLINGLAVGAVPPAVKTILLRLAGGR